MKRDVTIMASSDEPKMNELKRLLHRLDGLDSRRSLAGNSSTNDAEQSDYVGTLRGAPDQDDGATTDAPKPRDVSARSAALLAAVIVGLLSTATVYVFMSSGSRVTAPTAIRPVGAPPAGTASPATDRGDAAMEIVRTAAALVEKGDIDAARELLRRAAELGSGPAALELARTYDPAQAANAAPQPRETNAALARVWYERARELGMAGASGPTRPSGQ